MFFVSVLSYMKIFSALDLKNPRADQLHMVQRSLLV